MFVWAEIAPFAGPWLCECPDMPRWLSCLALTGLSLAARRMLAACALAASLATPAGAEEPPSDCATAFQSSVIRGLEQHVEKLGVKYEEMFDAALRGHKCTHSQITEFLSEKRGFEHEQTAESERDTIEYYRYSSPFPLNLIRLKYGISVQFSVDGQFLRSNWEVSGAI
jgi:hypothetical protein